MNTALDPHAAFAAAIRRVFTWPRNGRASFPARIAAASEVHSLQNRAILVVPRPIHRKIVCLRGCLWITHDGDPKDIVLDAGQSYRPDRHARMLIQALQAAELRVTGVAGREQPRC